RGAILQAAMQGKLTEQLDSDTSIESLLESIECSRSTLLSKELYKPDKKLRPLSDDEIPFDVPEHWNWIKLGYCSTYGQTKKKATAEEIKSDIWSLDLEDIEKVTGRILSKEKASQRNIVGDKVKFFEGNILYSKLRPYLLKILIADEDGICTPELIPFDMIGKINPKYIMWVLRSPHVDYAINAVTYGVKMPRVGTETMVNLLIPLPPIEEQQRIVERLDALLPLCDTLTE
ncbi:MAG: restriction endonuclease subunit S, partial [Anaerovoracaceae bacterium]